MAKTETVRRCLLVVVSTADDLLVEAGDMKFVHWLVSARKELGDRLDALANAAEGYRVQLCPVGMARDMARSEAPEAVILTGTRDFDSCLYMADYVPVIRLMDRAKAEDWKSAANLAPITRAGLTDLLRDKLDALTIRRRSGKGCALGMTGKELIPVIGGAEGEIHD